MGRRRRGRKERGGSGKSSVPEKAAIHSVSFMCGACHSAFFIVGMSAGKRRTRAESSEMSPRMPSEERWQGCPYSVSDSAVMRCGVQVVRVEGAARHVVAVVYRPPPPIKVPRATEVPKSHALCPPHKTVYAVLLLPRRWRKAEGWPLRDCSLNCRRQSHG